MNTTTGRAEALAHVGHGMTIAQSALTLATSGIPVFPCITGGKRPAVARGFLEASSIPEVVSRWWAAMPSANIGMPTGSTSGLVAVDVDVHGSVNGYDALKRAELAGLIQGWDAAVRTPSGGLHLFFPADAHVEQRSWQSARAGVDFRGDGGYVIVPPSLRTIDGYARQYEVVQLAHEPGYPLDSQKLRDHLDPPRRTESRLSARTPQQPIDLHRLADWVSRRLEGERNHGLFWAACKMAEQQVPGNDAIDALGPAAERIGLSQREAAATIRSAYRAVQGSASQHTGRAGLANSLDRPLPASNSRTLT